MKKAVFLSFLLAAAFLSLGLPRVSAAAILITPMDTTIIVAPNETFVLAYKMLWDEPDPGYFSATVYWDCADTTPYWNFTYIDFVCKFANDTDMPGVEWNITKGTPQNSTTPRYILQHKQTAGVWGNGEFWLNVTMRAAGVVNGVYSPHAGGDQNIVISMVRCYEETTTEAGGRPCTIRVPPWIASCNSTGAPKEGFLINETVYVKGYGFPNSTDGITIRLYVVPNTMWTDGKVTGTDVRGAFNLTSVDPTGNLTITALGTLPLGEYDIVADVNNNSIYDAAPDTVDEFTSLPGIIVVPEFSFGMAIAIMAILTTTSIIYVRNRKYASFI